jgi:hypothetical protein
MSAQAAFRQGLEETKTFADCDAQVKTLGAPSSRAKSVRCTFPEHLTEITYPKRRPARLVEVTATGLKGSYAE